MGLLFYDNIDIKNSNNNTIISLSVEGNGGIQLGTGLNGNGQVNILSTKVGDTNALILASSQNFTIQDSSGHKTLLLNYNGGEFYSFGTNNGWVNGNPNLDSYKVKISGYGESTNNNFGFISLRDNNNNEHITLTSQNGGSLQIGGSNGSTLTSAQLHIGGSNGSTLTSTNLNTTSIKGRNIDDIFETNSTTVKNSTKWGTYNIQVTSNTTGSNTQTIYFVIEA